MKFNLAFDDVKGPPVCAKVQTKTLHPFIRGRIGFEEWMTKALNAAEAGGDMQLHHPQKISSLGHTFEFIVDVNANAGAGFIIAPAPTIGINPAFTVDRVDDGVVDVVIAKPAVDPLPEVIMALTKQERELAEQLKKLIAQKDEDIKKRKAELQSPANQELLAKVPSLGTMSIESIRPGDEGQQKEFHLTAEQLRTVRRLKSLEDANRADQQKIDDYLNKIPKPVPEIRIAPRVLPPDRNPEISSVSTQLTLERLNNSLRVVVP
jgi:hypothetical protein